MRDLGRSPHFHQGEEFALSESFMPVAPALLKPPGCVFTDVENGGSR
jgi:hypothetical protein